MARRLNKNLVVGLTITGMLAIAGAGILLIYNLPGRDPRPMVDKAEELVADATAIEKKIAEIDGKIVDTSEAGQKDLLRKERTDLQEQMQEKLVSASRYYGNAHARARTAGDTAAAAEYLVKAGDLALKAGDQNGALDIWKRVLLNDTSNEAAQQKIVEVLLEQAETYPYAERWNELRKEAERLVADGFSPKNAIGLHALGRALSANSNDEDMEKAGACLTQAYELDKANTEFANSLAFYGVQSIQLKLQDALESKDEAKAAALRPQRDEAVKKGLEIYESLIASLDKTEPKNEEELTKAWRQLAHFHMYIRERQQVDLQMERRRRAPQATLDQISAEIDENAAKALDCLNKALAVSPEDVETLVLLGVYWQTSLSADPDEANREAEVNANYAKSKEVFERAIKADPDSFDAYTSLQGVYLRDAQRAFQDRDKARLTAAFDSAARVLEERIKRGPARSGIRQWQDKAMIAQMRYQLFSIKSGEIEQLRSIDRQSGAVEKDITPIIAELRSIHRDFVAESRGGEKDPLALFMKARLHMLDLENGRIVEAINAFRELELLVPGGNELWLQTKVLLAQLFLQINEPGTAVENLQAVLKFVPNNETSLAMLARALAGLPDRLADAEDAAKKALALNPKNLQALNALASVYEQQKNWKALEEIREAASANQAAGGAELLEASLQISRGMDPANPDKGLIAQGQAKLRKLLEADPSNMQALRTLVSTFTSGESDRKETVALIERATKDVEAKIQAAAAATPVDEKEVNRLKVLKNSFAFLDVLTDPNAPNEEKTAKAEALIRQNPDRFMVEVELYRLLIKAQGRQAEAIEHLKAAHQMKPDEPAVVEMLFRAAITSFKDDNDKEVVKPDWDLAEKMAKKAADLGIDRSDGHYYLGQILLAKQDFAGAERELREALRIFPVNSNGHARLGQVLAAQQRVEEALESLHTSLAQNPRNPTAAYVLAKLATVRGDEEGKRKYLMLCKELNLESEPWVAEQLLMIEDQENPAAAIERREAARKADPKDAMNLASLADLYARSGQVEKAKQALAECHALEPKKVGLVNNYVVYLLSQNPPDVAGAEAAITKSLESFGPDEKPDKAAVQMLRAKQLELLADPRRGLADPPTPEAIEAAYLEAEKTAATSAVLREISGFYLRIGKADKGEEYLSRAVTQAVADEDRDAELKARRARIELLANNNPDYKRVPDLRQELDAYRAKFTDSFGLIAMSRLASMTGRETAAVDFITQFINATSGEDKAFGYYQRGQMNYRRGDWEMAIGDLRDAKSLVPAGFDYDHRILLARCLQLSGQPEQAIAELTGILSENRGVGRATEELFNLYRRTERYDDAEAVLLPLYQANPKSPMLAGLLADIAFERKKAGDVDRALQRANEVVELTQYAPQNVDRLLLLYLRANRSDGLLQYVATKLPEATRSDARIQARVVTAHLAKGETDKAAAAYEAVVAGASLVPIETLELVLQMRAISNSEAAVEFLEAQAAKRPDDLFTQLAAANMLKPAAGEVAKLTGEERRARIEPFAAALEALLPKLPTEASPLVALRLRALQELATVYQERKDLNGTRKAYEQILELAAGPSMFRGVALNNLAFLLMENLNEPEAALPYAEEAARMMSNSPNVLDTLGWNLILTGQLDRGIATIRQAIGLSSVQDAEQVASVHYHAAVGLHKRSMRSRQQGQNAEADQDLAEAKLDCRRAHEALMRAGTDANDLIGRIAGLGTELGLTLSPTLPEKAAAAAAR